MEISLRSMLTAGVTAVTASALVAAPSVQPLPTPAYSHAPVSLTAAVTPVSDFVSAIERGIPAVAPNLAIPGVDTQLTESELNEWIKELYVWGEAWVAEGVAIATDVIVWIPYVGYIAHQIPMLYRFGERIVRSIVFNIDDWIFGPLPFWEGLSNVLNDSWDSLVQLGREELNWFLPGYFPLPPILPPLPGSATSQAGFLAGQTSGLAAGPLGKAIAAATAKLTVKPDVQTGSPAQVPAAVVESLNTPAVVESLNTPAVVDPGAGPAQPSAPTTPGLSVDAQDGGQAIAAESDKADKPDKADKKDGGARGAKTKTVSTGTAKAGHADKSKADKPAGKHGGGMSHTKAGAAK